jgi:D-glycero-D-manno-heptose 1,7-bisphosphate phosphatase
VRTGKGAAMSQAQLDALCAQVPGTIVHADLTAFADHMIRTERRDRAATGESDSGFGRLD